MVNTGIVEIKGTQGNRPGDMTQLCDCDCETAFVPIGLAPKESLQPSNQEMPGSTVYVTVRCSTGGV